MSLFVPALRITMLFLNVYESYKTLKPPPPSVRDPTRPSVRAMTQRKRDMKGCLAVWIVWFCFAAYERVIESLVSLFIPFYDEFKSMFMVFLIVTRARGAEPIFLHILRPIIKPYTGTLDGSLDLIRMTGDFIFALSAFPIHSAITWWHNRNKHRQEGSDSESEASSRSSTPAARATPSPEAAHAREGAHHEIWVPPAQAFESEDEEVNEAVDAPPEILDLTQEERAVEEWRKYPAFPSAYPASPLNTHSQLATISFSAHIYPPVPETQSGQDFHRSLLLSRNELNPSYADDLSDQTPHLYGIQHVASAAGGSTLASPTEHDSLSDDSMDDEDIFNMTLRTPLPPHGAARSRLMAKLSIPGPLASIPSQQSTAIPSAHTNVSFRTSGAWSQSSPSTESVSPAESSPSAFDLDRTIGPDLVRSNAHQMEEDFEDDDDTSKTSQSDATTKRPRSVRKRKVSSHLELQELSATSDTADEDSEIPSPASAEDAEDVYVPGEQKTPEVKRRRLVPVPRKASVSSTKAIQPRIVPRRPLATRSVDPPKSGKASVPPAASAPSGRKSTRTAAKPITSGPRAVKGNPVSSASRRNSAQASSNSSSTSSLARSTLRAGTSSKAPKDP
ncbi:hypothetical protein MD484_g4806, partial [Candolleomyces efflorescens]